ncbi:hypothetical protein RA265_29580, partial [Pseudomonas syringae pv. tagetis]|uniref:hypothetical protein n=1 Tax=Pseudomonas syringae group genomosp. 7 TaxID=251699 RepID=UPI0037706CDE
MIGWSQWGLQGLQVGFIVELDFKIGQLVDNLLLFSSGLVFFKTLFQGLDASYLARFVTQRFYLG